MFPTFLGLSMQTPDICCAPPDEEESQARETTADDDENCAVGIIRFLQKGVVCDIGNNNLIGRDIGLCDAREFGGA